VIIRLAFVYGDYDTKFVGTQLALARVYQYLEQELKWLWTKDLHVNTVHIVDTARALWAAAEWYAQGMNNWDAKEYGQVPIFNVVDDGNTTQGTFSSIIGEVFKIETGFQGQIISTFARMNLDSVVDDVNDETLGPWADLLEEANITRPGPLSPFMEKELLKDTDLSMDGSRFERVVGFAYEKPKITKDEVENIIESYKRMNWWP
jgi:nucleoside-diphosphate-sugar epimerase